VEPEAANLFFQLVSARYERASLIAPPTSPSAAGGGVRQRGRRRHDRPAGASRRSLKGDSYRLKDRDLGRVATAPRRHGETMTGKGSGFTRRQGQVSAAVDATNDANNKCGWSTTEFRGSW